MGQTADYHSWRRKMTNPDELELAEKECDRLWGKRLELDRAMKILMQMIVDADSRYDQEVWARQDIAKGLSKAARRFPWGDYWSLDGV
jgi:hypothetical protein